MAKPAERFLSLDVFRGLAIALMIVVNTPGPGAWPYPWLIHAKWIGFTGADWVFPSFLFAVGCAMAFSFSRPMSHGQFALKVLRRAGLIFLLGFLMYWFPFVHRTAAGWAPNPLADTRIMGVLQRIALCYALGAFAVRYLSVRWLIALSVGLLLSYWAILVAFNPVEPFSKPGNAGAWLDLKVLGQNHLYRRGGGFDPEGLLGTLPATVNVIIGYFAARVLRDDPDRRRVIQRLALGGLVLMASALAWSPVFPISKKLWTGSFVLLTVGSDLVVLAALVALIEGRAPNPVTRVFQVFGRNPLAIYLFSELFVTTLGLIEVSPGVGVYDWVGIHLFQAAIPGPIGSLLCAVAYTLVCWLLGYILDRLKIVVKL